MGERLDALAPEQPSGPGEGRPVAADPQPRPFVQGEDGAVVLFAGTLQARTEGWAAALWIAALGFRQAEDPDEFVATFAGDQAHLADYLTTEVLDHQPDDVRQFLLRTSSLDELCVDLCDAVTGTNGSGAMLERIERAGLFLIPLDTRRRAYRYHQLFADLLQVQLRRLLPDQVADLHSRAAAWYAAAGDPACAIRHYVQAGAYPQALFQIPRTYLTDLGSWLVTRPGRHQRSERRRL